jgi:hypothetical protein
MIKIVSLLIISFRSSTCLDNGLTTGWQSILTNPILQYQMNILKCQNRHALIRIVYPVFNKNMRDRVVQLVRKLNFDWLR